MKDRPEIALREALPGQAGLDMGSEIRPDPQAAARQGSYLLRGAGVLTLLNNYVPGSPHLNRGLLNFVGATALILGLLMAMCRSERSARLSAAALPMTSFALVAISNAFGNVSPYSYALYLVVIFVYIGLSQPPLTCLAYLPAAAATFIIPLTVSPNHSISAGLPSITVALPVCVLVAEIVARTAQRTRLARSQETDSLRALEISELGYRTLVENITEIVYRGQPDHSTGRPVFTFVSPQVEALLGYRPQQFLEDPALWEQLIHPADITEVLDMTRRLLVGSRTVTRMYRIRHAATAEYHWMDDRVVPQLDSMGEVMGFLGVARDVTAQKAREADLEHQAFHDDLTGLPNRVLLHERLDHALARSQRERKPVAVLNLDLDGFKQVNDRLGHAAGDALLAAVADRLVRNVRMGDTVARIGGDEFVILLDAVQSAHDAERVASKLVACLAEPFEIAEQLVKSGVSVGAAVATAGTVSADRLLRDADAAMYAAKAAGRGCYRLTTETGIRACTQVPPQAGFQLVPAHQR